MTSTPQQMLTALTGGTPDVTPLSVHDMMVDDMHSPRWRRLFDLGLGININTYGVRYIEHGVRHVAETRTSGGQTQRIFRKVTPVGAVEQIFTGGWHTGHYIKGPHDYAVLKWIFDHIEVVPAYDGYAAGVEKAGTVGLVCSMRNQVVPDEPDAQPLIDTLRSPAMKVNVDYAGLEQFCIDVVMEVQELFALLESMERVFSQTCQVLARSPFTVVKFTENLSIEMLGPERYDRLLGAVYARCLGPLITAGKRVSLHFDGKLSAIADRIAGAPFHIVESLTEPPEGDMPYDRCRAAWPDKVFWGNINVDCYALPRDELSAAVIARRARAGKQGLAFEISEALPANFEQSVPVVLRTLQDLR